MNQIENLTKAYDRTTLSNEKKEQIRETLSLHIDERNIGEIKMNNRDLKKNQKKFHLTTMRLAAAIALVLVLSLGSIGVYANRHQIIGFLSGGTIEITSSESGNLGASSVTVDADSTPVTVIDNRVYFNANEENIDITDYLEQNGVFRYEITDVDGIRNVIAVAGTSQRLEWVEFLLNPDGSLIGSAGQRWDDEEPQWLLDIRSELGLD